MATRGNALGSALLAVALVSVTACSSGPVAIDKGASCAFCRMTIANERLAAQIVAPGEEPRLYDDIGCLVSGIEAGALREMGTDATAYVADHRTGGWVKAADAVYSRVETLDTPMGSHIVAHADVASRSADPAVSSGIRLTAREVGVLGRGTDGR